MSKKDDKDLKEAIGQIKERFGEGSIMKLEEVKHSDIGSISTGSMSLDVALGIGGIPKGRVVEVYGPEASGKCVRADSIVFSEMGMLPISVFGDPKTLKFQKKEVFIHSESSYEKTSHFYNGGVKKTIKVKTGYGFEIEGTPNHRVRVIDNSGNYLFRRLDELKETDHVAIQRGQGSFGNGVDLSDFEDKVWNRLDHLPNARPKEFKRYEVDTKMAELMGYMIGNGNCTGTAGNGQKVSITVGDDEVAEHVKNICKNIFGEEPKVTPDKRTKSTRRMEVHNVKARTFLHYAGVGWWKSEEKEIPWSVMTAPKEIVASFLKTLFESDGSVLKDGSIEYVTKSESLANHVQMALLNFGILAKKKAGYNKEHDGSYFYLYVDGQEDRRLFEREVGFVSKRKRRRLQGGLDEIKQFSTNRDVVPNINEKLASFLEAYRAEVRSTNRDDRDLFYDYLPQTKGHSNLTYERLGIILEHFEDGRNIPEYQEMERLYEFGFFWDTISSKEDSSTHVMDFTVPSNATFFANGFVNHNTSVSLHIIAEAQRKGGQAAFVDAEHALDPVYAQKIGVDVKDLFVAQPSSGDEALQIVEALVRSGTMDVVVIDSVAALVPKAEIEGEIGEFQIGLQARMMSQALRKLASIVSQKGTSVIFLNQTRMKVASYGNPETTSGGLALKFYSSVRIRLGRRAKIKSKGRIIGNRVKAKVVKNKVAPPFKTAEFDIYYSEGISQEADIIKTGEEMGVVERSGAWYSFGEEQLGQGMEASKKRLREDKDLRKKIKEDILEKIKEMAQEEAGE